MGLLDDAIREHLDLKRARGADPAVIERMEREALGPVRREPAHGSVLADPAAEHAQPRFASEQHEEHLTELEDLQELGYHDSTAPHPHLHHHEHAEHYAEHADAPHLGPDDALTSPEEPADEAEPSKRRFLRRSRPASLSEDEAAQSHLDLELDPHEQGSFHDDLAHHETDTHADLAQHVGLGHGEPSEHHEPISRHEQVEHDESAEIHEPVEHPDATAHRPSPDNEPAPAPTSTPPQLRFEHPPKRPRFSSEPPTHEGAHAGEPPAERHEPQETTEFDVERHMAETRHEDDEDVLEETPEFLQDTPEHDRLWFEQRPPKDFDFDG